MVETFREARRAAVGAGVGARIRFWARELGHLATLRLSADARPEGASSGLASTAEVFSGLGRDARLALRGMRRTPGTTAVVVGLLAVGIGANTAIFSTVHRLLLRPLPLDDPDRLVVLFHAEEGAGADALSQLSTADYLEWRARTRTLASMAFGRYRSGRLTAADRRGSILVQEVSTDFFDVLGVRPARGRGFVASDGDPSAPPTTVISHEMWEELGSPPDVVGSELELDGTGRRVVGILPEGFRNPADINLPLAWVPRDRPGPPDDRATTLFAMGRLADGVSLADARAELRGIADDVARRHPETNAGRTARVLRMRDFVVREARGPVLLLMTGVGLLLLLTCANVAQVMLARGVDREREVAVRRALGASRLRVVRQLLVEALLLAAAGAAVGALLAAEGSALTAALVPERMVGGPYEVPALNLPALAFTGAVAVGTALLFALPPARRVWRLGGAGGGWGSASRGTIGTSGVGRVRGALIAGEVALSFVLVAAAGLLVRSALEVGRLEPGFRVEEVLTLRAGSTALLDRPAARRADVFRAARDEIERLPGVAAAGAGNLIPPAQPFVRRRAQREGSAPADVETAPSLLFRIVAPGYFEALDIPRLEGRVFDDGDDAGSRPVGLLDRTAARRLFGGESAVGRALRVAGLDEPVRVVGVVGDVRGAGIPPEREPTLYVPMDQHPLSVMSFAVRAEGTASADRLADAVRDALWSVEPSFSVYQVETMASRMRGFERTTRTTTAFAVAFGGLALLLVLSGVFGVVSFVTARRTQELGLRMALGADRREVLSLVTGDGLRWAGLGLALGLAVALLATRALAPHLYGVSPTDPLTYAGLAVFLLATIALATLVPALRAVSVDPATVLESR